MRRALAAVCAAALVLAASPAAAHASVMRTTLTEDSTGVSPMDSGDGISACVGYTGLVYEARHGLWKVTVGTRDGHVEGEVHASFRIFPRPGYPGITYSGTYVEHDVGRFSVRDFETPHPNAMFQLRARAVGTDGSVLQFHEIGQTHIDLRTGAVKRERYTLNCAVR